MYENFSWQSMHFPTSSVYLKYFVYVYSPPEKRQEQRGEEEEERDGI